VGAKHLSKRKNWQTVTSAKVAKNEKRTRTLLVESLNSKKFEITIKPIVLIGKLTLKPELVVKNPRTGAKVIIDDKLGNNGGNAHERCYKYCTGKVEKAGYKPLIIFSGKTFASKKPYSYKDKKGKKIKVNPQRYRDEFEELLDPEQYFILTGNNGKDLCDKIEELLTQ